MNKRPIAVTAIAWLLIIVGIFSFGLHSWDLISHRPFNFEDLWIPVVGGLSAVFGVFVLLGHGWARWLVLAWMLGHVAIGFMDSMYRAVVHVLLLALIAYALFRADARTYFRNQKQSRT